MTSEEIVLFLLDKDYQVEEWKSVIVGGGKNFFARAWNRIYKKTKDGFGFHLHCKMAQSSTRHETMEMLMHLVLQEEERQLVKEGR
jgi:hypothetical protein